MKTLLIVFGSLFLAMVVLIIIANCIPSFADRRKRETSQTPSAPKTKRRFGPIMVIILLALAVVLGIFILRRCFPAAVYPIAADAQDIWPKVGETVKVKIYPDYWSGWINLPPNVSFLVDTPGEVEVRFWSGQRFFIRDKEPRRWLGDVPHCSFRLRGMTGEATITIQVKQNSVSFN